MSTIELNGMAREVRWRQQIQPDLAVLVEDSGCIVLECGSGEPKCYVTLSSSMDLTEAIGSAKEFARVAEVEADQCRWREVDEVLTVRKRARHGKTA